MKRKFKLLTTLIAGSTFGVAASAPMAHALSQELSYSNETEKISAAVDSRSGIEELVHRPTDEEISANLAAEQQFEAKTDYAYQLLTKSFYMRGNRYFSFLNAALPFNETINFYKVNSITGELQPLSSESLSQMDLTLITRKDNLVALHVSYNPVENIDQSGATVLWSWSIRSPDYEKVILPLSVQFPNGQSLPLTSLSKWSFSSTGRKQPYPIKAKAIVLPSTIEIIEEGAFRGNKLTSVSIPSKVKKIDKNAFIFNKLQTVDFPSKMQHSLTIGEFAFASNSFSSITLPKMDNGSQLVLGHEAFSSRFLSKVKFLDPFSIRMQMVLTVSGDILWEYPFIRADGREIWGIDISVPILSKRNFESHLMEISNQRKLKYSISTHNDNLYEYIVPINPDPYSLSWVSHLNIGAALTNTNLVWKHRVDGHDFVPQTIVYASHVNNFVDFSYQSNGFWIVRYYADAPIEVLSQIAYDDHTKPMFDQWIKQNFEHLSMEVIGSSLHENNISPHQKGLTEWFQNLGRKIRDGVVNAWHATTSWISNTAQAVINLVGNTAEKIWNGITRAGEYIYDFLMAAPQYITGAFSDYTFDHAAPTDNPSDYVIKVAHQPTRLMKGRDIEFAISKDMSDNYKTAAFTAIERVNAVMQPLGINIKGKISSNQITKDVLSFLAPSSSLHPGFTIDYMRATPTSIWNIVRNAALPAVLPTATGVALGAFDPAPTVIGKPAIIKKSHIRINDERFEASLLNGYSASEHQERRVQLIMHEIGHSLGLKDIGRLYDESIMSYVFDSLTHDAINKDNKAKFTRKDKKNLEWLYK